MICNLGVVGSNPTRGSEKEKFGMFNPFQGSGGTKRKEERDGSLQGERGFFYDSNVLQTENGVNSFFVPKPIFFFHAGFYAIFSIAIDFFIRLVYNKPCICSTNSVRGETSCKTYVQTPDRQSVWKQNSS